MAVPLTLRQMRERIRILKLGRSTALLAGVSTVEGDPAPNDKKFSNELINLAIEETISELNILCGLGGGQTPVSKSVTAQTADGPLVIDLSTAWGPREADTNEVNKVWWNDGTSGNVPLTNRQGRNLDANRIDYHSLPASRPSLWWVDHYSLWVAPAPITAGTIYALTGSALYRPVNDDDTIAQLPGDLYHVVLDGAGLKVCASQPDDKVMASAARQLETAYYKIGIPKVQMALGLLNGQDQAGCVAEPYRQRRGCR